MTPEELVAAAAAADLSTFAVTDHDIVAAVQPARRATEPLGIELVAGVEFSSNLDGREVHVLGLFIDENSPALLAAAERARHFRHERAADIVDRLQSLDLPVELAAVEAAAQGGSVGRPHIAQALLSSGAVASLDEAFHRYIGVGRPAFAPKPTLGAAEVIGVVHHAGGVAILAHPASSRVPEESIHRLASFGLDGFEVIHPKHGAEATKQLRKLADRTGLLPSGGSDYHGPGSGRARLGQYPVPPQWLDALREAAFRRRRASPSAEE